MGNILSKKEIVLGNFNQIRSPLFIEDVPKVIEKGRETEIGKGRWKGHGQREKQGQERRQRNKQRYKDSKRKKKRMRWIDREREILIYIERYLGRKKNVEW